MSRQGPEETRDGLLDDCVRPLSGAIYLLRGDDDFVEMRQAAYEREDILQELLAKYPSLLAGDEISPAAPRRWLLIRREAGIAEEDGGARWSLDHLFLDQDAVPTLVEVKRSSDSRIRREVIGQMLDYAANAVAYLPIERVRSWLADRCSASGLDPDALLRDMTDGGDVEQFWSTAENNLLAGHVRLIFIADAIPRELQRIVEFLNGQMDPAEVLAIEVKQYTSVTEGALVRTLVPRLIGQTGRAEAKTARRTSSPLGDAWTTERFIDAVRAVRPDDVPIVERVLRWASERGLREWWGRGQSEGSYFPMLDTSAGLRWTFALKTAHTNYVQLQFPLMAKATRYAHADSRLELIDRLNGSLGTTIPTTSIDRLPSFAMARLAEPARLEAFLAIFDEVVERSRETSAESPL